MRAALYILRFIILCSGLLPVAYLRGQAYSSIKNHSKTYFLNNNGNDSGNGSRQQPWQSIARLNRVQLHPGDSVCFAGGQVFNGTLLLDAADKGSKERPIVISSSGTTAAVINAGNASAIEINNTAYISIIHLHCLGAGRKTGNTQDGLLASHCSHVIIDSLSISGFQKAGLCIYASSTVMVNRVHAFENGFAGILVSGAGSKKDCRNILIRYCFAENNPGDPTNLSNHSGNGILAGLCTGVTIEYCSASNNGWDMPRTGNGPVGIWAYEADSVLIQHCISYRNKTSQGGKDGGGFDLDGGVTHSTIQYCLSYDNQGSGYGLFQYNGASHWQQNTLRFNISENDGAVTAGAAGILIWNNSDDTSQFKDCSIYNNTVYNTKRPALRYDREHAHIGFRLLDNILVGRDTILTGQTTGSRFLGNCWYSLQNGFLVEGFSSLRAWSDATANEYQPWGVSMDPLLKHPGQTSITDPTALQTLDAYRLPARSWLRTGGVDLQLSFLLKTGGKTLNGAAAGKKLVGACE